MPIGDIGGRIEQVVSVNPELADDPETTMDLAQSSLEDRDIMDLAEDQRGMAYVEHLVTELKKLPEGDQWEQWNMLTSDRQSLYKQFGYEPKPYEDTSLLRRVTKAAGWVGNILDPTDLVEDTFGMVLGGMQEASDFTTHLYRFSQHDGEDTLAGLRNSWRATADGESYWREGEKEEILGSYEPKYHQLVTDMASGMTEEEYVQDRLGIDRTDPRWDEAIFKIHGQMLDPKVNEAIVKLTNNKVSIGRDVRSWTGLNPESTWNVSEKVPIIGGRNPAELLSGTVDGAWRILADPTLAAGRVKNLAALRKYGIPGVSKAEMLPAIEKFRDTYHAAKAGGGVTRRVGGVPVPGAGIGKVGFAAERIAFHFKNGSIDQLIREMPGIQHMIRDMEAFHHHGRALTGLRGMDEVDGVFDFYSTGAGIEAISAGRHGTRAFRSASIHSLPMASARRVPIGRAKEGVEEAIDVGRFRGADTEAALAKYALDSSTPLAKRIGATAALGVWQPIRVTAEGVHHLTNMIPKDTFINPNKPESVEIFRQILAFHMPKGFRDDMLNQWVLNSHSTSFKKMLSDRVLLANADSSGMLAHPKGQNFIQRFVGRSNHSYAAMNLDRRIMPNGQEVRAGIYPTQWANAWAVPSFRKQMEAAKNAGHMMEMTQNGVDFMMSQIWKPSVLLRVGFIPRAFGEELIWSMAQYGSKMNLSGHALLMSTKDPTTPFPIMRPVLGMTRILAKNAPGITKYPLSALDTITQFTFKQTARGTRNVASLIPTEKQFANFRHMVEYQGSIGTAAAETSASHMTGLASEVVDEGNLIYVQRPDGYGGFNRVGFEMGAPELVQEPVKELGGLNRILYKMESLAEHDPGRIMIDGIARRLKPAEIDEALQEAYRLGIVDNVNDFDGLRALIPEDMPSEWDDFLISALDTPNEVVRDKMRKALIASRQRADRRLQTLDPEDIAAREFETIGARPPMQEIDEVGEEFIEEIDEAVSPEWWAADEDPWPGPKFHDDDALDEDLRRLVSGESPDDGIVVSDDFTMDDEIAASRVSLSTRELPDIAVAEAEADQILDFIATLPENYRRALFRRNGALDRHVRSQGLADRKLVDPNWLNDDQMEDLAGVLNRTIDETPGLEGFDYAAIDGDTLQSIVGAALRQGVDEAVLATHLKRMYAKWKGEGYEGILHPTGKRATLWGSNGVAARGMVARGERDLLNRYYRAMREGNTGEMHSTLQEAVASRYGRGDMEYQLQGADVATGLKDGTPLATPARQGFNRVYTLTVPNNASRAHPGFIPDPAMANTDAAYLAMSGQQAVDLGVHGVPEQAWFTADYQQVKRLKADMTARGDATPSIGFIDIPTQEFDEGRALARNALAGGLDPEADVRQLATVFLKRQDRNFDLKGIPEPGMERTPVGRHAQEARDELDRLTKQRDEVVAGFEKDIATHRALIEEMRSPDWPFPDTETQIAGLERKIAKRQQGIDEILAGRHVTDEGGPILMEITARLDDIPAARPGEVVTAPSINPGEEVYIYFNNEGEIVGGAAVKLVDDVPESIPAIAVEPAWRNQGIGTKLFRAIDDDFGEGTVAGVTGKSGYSNQGAAFAIGRAQKRIKEIEQELADTILAPGVDRGVVLEELAATNMADTVMNTFSNPFDDADPRDLRHLAYELDKTGKVSWESIDNTEVGHLPKNMSLPRLLEQSKASWLKRFNNQRFDEIGRAGNAIVRHPIFASLYSDALEGMGALRDMITDPKVMKSLDDLAAKYGFQRDEMVSAWMRLPDEVRFSADPVTVGARHNVKLPREVENITPADAQRLNQAMSHTKYVEQHISDVTMERATRHLTPYLDDHRLRSQFQERHRHLIPFQFAEEQFLKRWGRTLMDNPEVLQKAQLTFMGLKHVGYITENQYGEPIYEFPGSELFMKAVSHAMQTITRQPMVIPLGNPFTGQIKYSVAGVDRYGVPSVGPMMGIGFSIVQRFLPEIAETEFMHSAKSAIYGERGHNRTVAQQIMPTTVYNMYNALVADPESDQQMASAMMTAAANMEANDDEHFKETGERLVPGVEATDHERDQYQLRLQNHARMMLFARGALGFFTPATPIYKVEADMSPRFIELLKQMPIEEATRIFLLENPDGMPWTVFDTKSISGAPLPATDAAYKVLDNNESFFQNYSMAGPWFLPPSDNTDEYASKAYYQQMRHNMRVRKLPDEFQTDIAFAQAAPLYFSEKEKKDIALESWRAQGDREMVRQIEDTWRNWKTDYFEMNPLFANELQRPDSQQRRTRVLDQMTEAVNSPDAPNVPHLIPMRDLLNEYHRMQGALESWKPYNTAEARAAKEHIRESFTQWANHFVRYNPSIKPFYTRVIEYEVGGD